jgi:hypothetical protein
MAQQRAFPFGYSSLEVGNRNTVILRARTRIRRNSRGELHRPSAALLLGKSPRYHWIQGWVGLKGGLYALEQKENFFAYGESNSATLVI